MSSILENILFTILIGILCVLVIVTLMYSIKTTSTDKIIDNEKDNIQKSRKLFKKYIYCKRCFDIVISFFAIIFVLPLLVVFAIILKYDGVKSIIEVDKIIGYKNKIAKIYKFNTVKEVKEGKIIRSRIGRFLYITGLNELPMYFSVLKGDISIVGLEKIYDLNIDKDLIKEYQYYRPGIASIATVSKKKKSSFEFNEIYMQEASIKLDNAIFMDVIKKGINIQ